MPNDRLFQENKLMRFHCSNNQALDVLNRCFYDCSQCHKQCDSTTPPNLDGFPPVANPDSDKTVFSDHVSQYMILDTIPKYRPLRRRSSRDFAAPDYENACIVKNTALMVQNRKQRSFELAPYRC